MFGSFKDCDHRRNVYYRFFMTEIYNKCRLQFDFAPIQQLARYQLIIMDIKRQLEIEKAPQRVIDTVDETELELKKLIEKIHLMRNLPSHKLDWFCWFFHVVLFSHFF